MSADAEMIDMRDLVARASTLRERTGGVVNVRSDGERSARRLRRWAEVVARGDRDRFVDRLARDGLTEVSAHAVVGKATFHGELPAWVHRVEGGLRHLGDGDLDDDRCLPGLSEPPVALQELAVPFVRAGRDHLYELVTSPEEGLGPSVLPTMERELLHRLSSIWMHVGEGEFRAWRRSHIDPLTEALARAGGHPDRSCYDEWIRELRAGALGAVLARYAMLARLVGFVVLGWATATAAFLDHLRHDRTALARAFGLASGTGLLAEVGGATSDPHRGQRRVIGCRFESGLEVVYKPKSLEAELAYGSLIEWLNDQGAEPPLQTLKVVGCGDHGWVEQAQHREAGTASQVDRFYRRAGMLLALMYSVGGTDCHRENVIAAGEHPYIIDAETVLQPTLVTPGLIGEEEWDAVRDAAQVVSTSVLGVGLLPAWMFRPDGRDVDVSGLGATSAHETLDEFPRWEHPNTDVARLVLKRLTTNPAGNALFLGEKEQRPEDHLDQLEAGFTEGYRLVLDGRDELVAPGGPLSALDEAPVRVIFRGTEAYSRMLLTAQRDHPLGEGIDWSIEMEFLGRSLLDGQAPTSFWEVYRSEMAQLEAADVPHFEVIGREESWTQGAAPVELGGSATLTARSKLETLSAEDLTLQRAYLRASFGLLPDDAASPSTVTQEMARPLTPSSSGSRLVEAAVALGVELERSAIASRRGVAWVGLALGDEAQRWTLRPTAFDFYGGVPGISLFLAALARVTGERRWRDLSMDALASVLEAAQREPLTLALRAGIGGAGGAGGLLYALVLVAEVIEADQPLEAARRLAYALPSSALGVGRDRDLLGGEAGLASALLCFNRVCGGDERARELAAAAGSVLVTEAVERNDGERKDGQRKDGEPNDGERDDGPGWEGVIPGRLLDGFAHGTAGVSQVLARLGSQVREPAFDDLAARAIVAESRRFDATIGGWPDRRYPGERRMMTGWCHGAAGVGLSRLCVMGTPAGRRVVAIVEKDLERARRAVMSRSNNTDHLCCGTAGECEFLIDLARQRGDVEAGAVALDRLGEVADRVLSGDGPCLRRPQARSHRLVPLPGLFQGTSGVGWSLLRGADRELPSLLAWS